ncbi:MAG TPA: cysteine hydrolase family protein, partial [Thermoanaerobaculia bacterium]
MSAPALLIIDVQKAIDDPSWGDDRNHPGAEMTIASLLAHWRAQRWPIYHVRHASTEPRSTYRPGQPGFEFKDEVAPQADERIIEKSVNSAFIGTNLEQELRAAGIDSLVITGVITNNSVEATARMAGNLGFRTFVVADATATFGRNDFDGRWRTADEVHAMSLANLDGEYATVVDAAEIVRLLQLSPR